MIYLIVTIAIAIIITLLLINKTEGFNSIAITTHPSGIPRGEPRTRQILVSMGDHQTISTITHGTNGEFLILVHGYPLDQRVWTGIHEELAVRAQAGAAVPTLITYDLRGCGSAINITTNGNYIDNNPQHQDWSLQLFANDLYRIYQEIIGAKTSHQRKINIGGWGFGGCIAQQFALNHPDLLENLYLFSSFGPAASDKTNTLDLLSQSRNYHQGSLNTLPTEYVDSLLCSWFNIEDVKICPKTIDTINDIGTIHYHRAKSILTGANLFAELQVLKIIMTLDLMEQWTDAADIHYNVIIVAPTRDSTVPPNTSIKLYTAIKSRGVGLQLPSLVTPAGKHYYSLQHPQSVIELILR